MTYGSVGVMLTMRLARELRNRPLDLYGFGFGATVISRNGRDCVKYVKFRHKPALGS